MKVLSLIFFILLSSFCFSQDLDFLIQAVETMDIESLNSSRKKKKFLKIVFEADQKIRAHVTVTQEEYGYNSVEHKLSVRKWLSVDSILFGKTVAYLDNFGYPSKEKDGFTSSAIWVVLHHATGSINGVSYIELKQKYFPPFYHSYQIGELDQGIMLLYLNRLYRQIKKEKYTNNEFRDEVLIEGMIAILNLKRK